MEEIFDFYSAASTVAYLIEAVVLFAIGKMIFNSLRKGIQVNKELVEKDNVAVALAVVGYYTAIVIAIGSAIVGPSDGLMADLINIGIYGLFAIILLNLSAVINDKWLFRKFSFEEEIVRDQNAGVGLLEGANYIASGLIIYGAVTGEGTGLVFGLVTATVYWLIGQVLLFVALKIYNRLTHFDVYHHIEEQDNVALSAALSGLFIAVGNLIRFGLMGDFEDWITTGENVLWSSMVGLVLLMPLRVITDKVLLPSANLTDEIIHQEKPNLGAGIIEGFVYIAGSVLLTWCL